MIMVKIMIKKYEKILKLDDTIAKKLFDKVEYPWEVLPEIKNYILEIIPTLGSEYIKLKNDVYVHKSVQIDESAHIDGPSIIGENSVIRHSAYIRGSVIIGKDCVIGNSTEVKNAILFDGVACPHFNYIGDSILGSKAHTGAGVILSNVKSDNTNAIIRDKDNSIDTNLRKMGSIIGNNVEIGCNSVICPGTIINSNVNIYPLTMVRGVIPENVIVKSMDNIINKK